MQVPCSEGIADHTGPRVMAVSPRGVVASVDRGRYGPGIEPRNARFRSADALGRGRKATLCPSYSQEVRRLRAVRDPMHVPKFLARNPGGPVGRPWPVAKVRAAKSKVQPR